jgi:CheY-like chemotaxis protein
MAQGSAKRILVVEDEDTIRATIAEALEFEGYTVDSAENGAIALERVRQARPDAIVLDLMMPIMDGWSFLRACREQLLCAEVPVLVTSAYRNLVADAPELGVQACLAKPFDLEVLLGAVERLVRRTPDRAARTG